MRFALGWFLSTTLFAGSHDNQPLIEIQAPGVFGSMSRAVYPARATAVEVFSKSGIRLSWRLPLPAQSAGRNQTTQSSSSRTPGRLRRLFILARWR